MDPVLEKFASALDEWLGLKHGSDPARATKLVPVDRAGAGATNRAHESENREVAGIRTASRPFDGAPAFGTLEDSSGTEVFKNLTTLQGSFGEGSPKIGHVLKLAILKARKLASGVDISEDLLTGFYEGALKFSGDKDLQPTEEAGAVSMTRDQYKANSQKALDRYRETPQQRKQRLDKALGVPAPAPVKVPAPPIQGDAVARGEKIASRADNRKRREDRDKGPEEASSIGNTASTATKALLGLVSSAISAGSGAADTLLRKRTRTAYTWQDGDRRQLESGDLADRYRVRPPIHYQSRLKQEEETV